ncbi:MAG: response regulator [Cellulosilyticaceae bacterium]
MKLQEMRVLVSDDSLLMRKKLKDMVAAMGVGEVLEASNGQEAIDLYKEQEPDMVFMDIIMPEKTGIEAIQEIMEAYPNAYIVIVSSIGTKNKLKEAIKAGARDFLQKPIQQDKVEEMIKHYINQ